MDDRFIRTEQLLGRDALEKLALSRLAIFGLGAVGSYALEALARAGIGTFILVDFDVVRLSNFNRQLLALEENTGKSKVELAKARVLAINPKAQVFAFNEFAAKESFDKFFALTPDITLDCIDSLNPKAGLIEYCFSNNFKFFSSMGAGMRMDLFSVRTGLLNEVKSCPLAKALRKKLKKNRVLPDVPCVYSLEVPAKSKIAVKKEEDFYKRGRLRVPVGTISYIPAMFGLSLAQIAIKEILGGY